MIIDYGRGDAEVFVSPWTLVIYEQEFKADMIQDLFGKVVVRDEEEEEGAVTVFDYRDTNWTSVAKALWACLKAADDNLPPFKKWATTIGDLNMLKVAYTLIPVVSDGLFRSGGTASE